MPSPIMAIASILVIKRDRNDQKQSIAPTARSVIKIGLISIYFSTFLRTRSSTMFKLLEIFCPLRRA